MENVGVPAPPVQRPAAPGRRAWALAGLSLGLAGAIPFYVATTFIGDDHLFLAFSRYTPNPLAAFVRDQHGGEFYRPLAMLIWWVTARLGQGASWPFATLAFVLHVVVAAELGFLVRAVGGSARAAAIAGAVFFIAPGARDAAYWYSASTDLLAAAGGLGALLAVLRDRTGRAALLFAAACLSKETAIVFPVLAVLILRARRPPMSWRSIVRPAGVLAAIAVATFAVRTAVLHGAGRTGDPTASPAHKLLQIGAGLLVAGPGSEVVSPPLGWVLGGAMWLALALGAAQGARSRRARDAVTRAHDPLVANSSAQPSAHPQSGSGSAGDQAASRVSLGSAWAPALWTALTCVPLLAAPWVVGSRYFYLPSVGIAWMAGDLLNRAPVVARVGVVALLAGLSFSQAVARAGDISAYKARLSAARRAVTSGTEAGHATFHIAAGIKDLDLAIKNDRRVTRDESTLVVLSDVPSSFIAIPPARTAQLDFLLAHPPLPPSGGYEFGARRIVGLARRGDDPTIDEVIARLPDIRFIRLRSAPGGRVIWRDVTDTWQQSDDD